MRIWIFFFFLTLTSCASSGAQQPSTDAGAVGPYCELSLVQPSTPEVGQDVELSLVVTETDTLGAHTYAWAVDLAGIFVPVTSTSALGDRVSFSPTAAGPYRVVVQASIGTTDCFPAAGDLNVALPGAIKKKFRMRVVPAAAAPTQDLVIEVLGGANASLPAIVVDEGVLVQGVIRDSTGAGVPGYLRARQRGVSEPIDFEAFASDNGGFSLRLSSARFDVLFVPSDPSVPSGVFLDLPTSELATLTLLPPQSISGVVYDSTGTGVSGLRLSLRVEGVDTTTATTAADGRFTVQGRYGTLSGLRVAAAVATGLPSLRADELMGQVVNAESSLVIRYSLATISVSANITVPQGGAAGNAIAEWRSEIPIAATISAGAEENVAGSLRVAVVADGAGLAEAVIPNQATDFVAHSADGATGLVARGLLWPSAANQQVALSERIMLRVSTTDESGNVVTGARVTAAPQNVLLPTGAPVDVTTDVAGVGDLALIRGASYEISVRALGRLLASQPVVVDNVGAGALSSVVELHPTLSLSGRLSGTSLAIAGASISLHCFECSGDDRSRTLVSATADSAGRFVLQVMDPGVEAL